MGSDAEASPGLQLFREERMKTANMKGLLTTYGQCLKALFLIFGAIGFLVGAISVCKSMY